MATIPIKNIVEAMRDRLRLRIVAGQVLADIRYCHLAADPMSGLYQLLACARSFPSLLVVPGEFPVDHYFTGGGYDYRGEVSIWICCQAFDEAAEVAVIKLLGYEGHVRDILHNQTLNVTGLQRILFTGVGSSVIVPDEEGTDAWTMTPVRFSMVGKEIPA